MATDAGPSASSGREPAGALVRLKERIRHDVTVYTGSAGVNVRLFSRVGLSVEARYLRSHKSRGGLGVVDLFYDWSW